MPVDKAELAKDLDSPEYQELVKSELAKKEFVIQDKATYNSTLEKFKTEGAHEQIKVVHDKYDKDIKDLFGIDRTTNEKSYDYLKRAAGEKLTGLTKQIDTLNDQIKKGDPTGVLAKKLEEAENLYKTVIKEKDDAFNKLRGEADQAGKNVALTSIYAGVKSLFKKELPPMFAEIEKSVLNELLKDSVLKDGVLYLGEAGVPKRNKAFEEVKMEDHLKEKFKDVIDVKRIAGGGGSGAGNGNEGKIDPNTYSKDNIVVPENVKTKSDLVGHLNELGIPRGTKQYNDIYSALSKKYDKLN